MERRCLKCDHVFDAAGKTNRLCVGCHNENNRLAELYRLVQPQHIRWREREEQNVGEPSLR
jgi:hypothetical protein